MDNVKANLAWHDSNIAVISNWLDDYQEDEDSTSTSTTQATTTTTTTEATTSAPNTTIAASTEPTTIIVNTTTNGDENVANLATVSVQIISVSAFLMVNLR